MMGYVAFLVFNARWPSGFAGKLLKYRCFFGTIELELNRSVSGEVSKRAGMLFMKLNGKSRKKELITSMAVMVISVSAYSAICEEAGAFIEPPGKSRLLSHRDCELPDFNSVIRTDMHRLLNALVPAQEDPCLPQADPEIYGIPADALDELSATLHGYVEDDYIVGAEFLIMKSGHIIMHEAYGWMDREELKPMEPNTIFNIRSMTKMLTGVSAQILIDEGSLSLDDTVSLYLPGFNNSKSGGITIEQLLTHRSGLPLSTLTRLDEFDDLYSIGNSIGEIGPEFTPGSKFWYSDAGSEALGAVVEVVSGVILDRFVRERLLYPLDMNDTFYVAEPEAPLDRFASLYIGIPGSWEKWWTPDEPFYPFAWGSQSLYSTPMDYARFLSMLMNYGTYNGDRILSEDAVDRVLTPVSMMTSLGSDMPAPTGFPFHRGLLWSDVSSQYIFRRAVAGFRPQRFRRYVGLGIPRTRHDDFVFHAIKRSGYRHKA